MPLYRVAVLEVWERTVIIRAKNEAEAQSFAEAALEPIREEAFEFNYIDVATVEEEVTE